MFEELEDDTNTSLLDGLVISNRYEVIRCLGSGAMGSVHLARDRLLSGNVVALKVLKREIADDQNVRQRFLQEVKLMHRVNHPNVVRTYDVGVDHDLIYFTMEYVTGISLEKIVESGQGINLELFLDISLQICAGLGQIHAAEIIHRDLKPANVMLADGKVKIADFGVARSSRSELTQHKEIIGSTPYIAPEIWMGNKLTKAADFYSLGAIFFELLIGHPPFEHDIPATIMWMHLKKSPDEPKTLRTEVPEWLNALILRMLAKSPENRPSSAEEIYNYISKRAKPGNIQTKNEKSKIERLHYIQSLPIIREHSALNSQDECAHAVSENSDIFLLSSANKSHDKSSYTSIVIKEYCANAFNSEGEITQESLSYALNAANNSLLKIRKENLNVTGISASLTALAITPTQMYLSFAGNIAAFTYGPQGLKKLTDAYQESCAWYLGTTLPASLDTHKIQYSSGQDLRILLASPNMLDSIGRRDLEAFLKVEDLELSINSLSSELVKRKPHISFSMILVDVLKKGNFDSLIDQVALSITSFDNSNKQLVTRDFKAFLTQDELDTSHKSLIFDEIEKPQSQLYEDPKESIIFSNLPSTDEIIRQQATLTEFSKQRLQSVQSKAQQAEDEIIEIENQKNKKLIIGLLMVGFVTVASLFALLFIKHKQSQTVVANTVVTEKVIGVNYSSYKRINSFLSDLKQTNFEIFHPMSSVRFNGDFQGVEEIKKEINLNSINITETITNVDELVKKAEQYNTLRQDLELAISSLKVLLKIAENTRPEQISKNLVETQKSYHILSGVVKSLSTDIITQRKRYLYWLDLADNLNEQTLLSFAQDLAIRKWQDSPRSADADIAWKRFNLVSQGNDSSSKKEALDAIKEIITEIIKIGLNQEASNLLKMSILLEETRFKRDLYQEEISNWRKGLKKDPTLNSSEVRLELNQKVKELEELDKIFSHEEMIKYRGLQILN